ncbi:hypothetical protein [Roseixanthobacter glucoisosaccharinicivorans]|uniref:hypothetical protein n=1 Tax=Roseixanthobacter glucoisosaccharinicivorans TaxID=3119923 RepID=UPI00372A34D8
MTKRRRAAIFVKHSLSYLPSGASRKRAPFAEGRMGFSFEDRINIREDYAARGPRFVQMSKGLVLLLLCFAIPAGWIYFNERIKIPEVERAMPYAARDMVGLLRSYNHDVRVERLADGKLVYAVDGHAPADLKVLARDYPQYDLQRFAAQPPSPYLGPNRH